MDSNQLIIFNLGEEEYAIKITFAKEIIRVPDFTKLPSVPEFIEGVFNLRGKVITVIDLKKRFGMGNVERGVDSRLLILDFDEMQVGVIVDDISEVVRIDHLAVQNLGNEIVSLSKSSIEGITIMGERLVILLNALKLKEDIFKYCSGKENVL